MKNEETICYKISRSIEDLGKAMKTGNLDALALVKRLHEMREQAQRMEEGLKLRKNMMIEAGLEEQYQSKKKKETTPQGVNKIAMEKEEFTEEKINIEVIIKRDGEIIYQNKAHAGVLCLVERVKDIDRYGQINGQTQKFTFGQPMMYWFAFDQLKQGIEARALEIMQSIRNAIAKNQFADPEVKRKIMEHTNKMEENKL